MLAGLNSWSSLAIVYTIWHMQNLSARLTTTIAFRDFILVLYSVNYLLSPAILYQFQQDVNPIYRMKIGEDNYFKLMLPAIVIFQIGLYFLRTHIFQPNLNSAKVQSGLGKSMLKQWLIGGVVLSFVHPYLPSDFAFFIYLLSLTRFVAAFALFVTDRKKYKWYLVGLLGLELVKALREGMFHDLVIWATFFGLFLFYVLKPTKVWKYGIGISAIILLYLLQIAKGDYRSQVWSGTEQGNLQTLQQAVQKSSKRDEGLLGISNVVNSLTRVNQAWILAGCVKRMNQQEDYQGLTLVGKYAEAAFLPRFLAPEKLQAGNKDIFNRFSDHYISKGTSMALGFFADGYIAYGEYGLYLFALLLGLIFSVIFRVVEKWAEVSPLFVLFIFPILIYAVRPDCETQTIMGHIVKGLFVFGILVWYFKGYFAKIQQGIAVERNATSKQTLTVGSIR